MKRAAFFLIAVAVGLAPLAFAASLDGFETIAVDSGAVVKIDRSPVVGVAGEIDSNAFAVGFYHDGIKLYEYRLGDLVVRNDKLEVRPDSVHWIKTSQINGDALHLETVDGQFYEFSISTGEIRHLRKKYN